MLFNPQQEFPRSPETPRGPLRRTLRRGGPLLLRLVLFLLVLWSLRPPRVLVIVGPPQTVHTTNPLVGVHTRLTDEVEEWKIQRTLQMVREMGAPWIVEFFPWPYIEPRPGQFDWAHSDMVIRHARAQGLTVIARLGFVPEWARPKDTTFNYIDPEFYDEFAAFVAAFLTHYRGEVNHVIIWNEPNLSLEWGYRPVDPVAYTEMLRAVYPAAQAANPDAVVLAGALASTLEPPGSPVGLNDLDYLEGMYAAGAAPYFDALAVHAYGTNFPPEAEPAPDVINFRRTELLRAIMEAHGDGHKPVYITEGGWNDHPRWARAVRPAQRVAYTVGAYEWARQNWPWCRAVAFWAFRYPAPLHNFQDYSTFVTDDFRPRPVYLAVQEYTGNDGMTNDRMTNSK